MEQARDNAREQAFEQVVRANLGWVYASACRRVRDAAVAEDVTQAVFVLLWTRLPQLSGDIRLSGWLYQAVRYCAANALRLERIRRAHERKAAMRTEATGTDVRWDELSEELDTALDSLNARDRDAILLRFFRGLSLADAGREMGISEDAARMRLQRALEKLRGVLQQRGIASSSAALSSLILTNAVPDAPAHLAGAIAASAGSAGGSAVSAIAAGGAKALWVAKIKVAAALALGVSVAAGTAAVVTASATARPVAAAHLATTTTAAVAAHDSEVFSRAYALGDLVVLPARGVAGTSLQQIQDQIVAKVEPGTWGDAGTGSIRPATGTSLVISHTATAHHEIEKLLDTMRAGRDVQVTVETRFIALRPELMPPEVYDPATKQIRSTYLDDAQVRDLVVLSQPNPDGSIVTAPRVTVFDGGEATVDVSTPRKYRGVTATTRPDGSHAYTPTEEETRDGLRQKIAAKTTSDRKVVRLQFESALHKVLGMAPQETRPERAGDIPVKFEMPQLQAIDLKTAIVIPSGKTAILGGGQPDDGAILLILVKPTVIQAIKAPQPQFPLLPSK